MKQLKGYMLNEEQSTITEESREAYNSYKLAELRWKLAELRYKIEKWKQGGVTERKVDT